MTEMEKRQEAAGMQKETEETKRGRRLRNTILPAALFAAVFIILFLVQRKAVPDHGGKAVIEVDGERIHEMSLDTDAEYRVSDASGHYNVVKVENGSVKVTEADCPNQVCVRTGAISNPGEVIACLPHGLIIFLE